MGGMARQSCNDMICSCSLDEESDATAASPSGSRNPVRSVSVGDSVITNVPMSILRVATKPIPFCSVLVIMYAGATGNNGPPGEDFNDGVMEMVDAEMLFVAIIDTHIRRQRRRRSRLQHRRRREEYMLMLS